jgi:hypothetical protein
MRGAHYFLSVDDPLEPKPALPDLDLPSRADQLPDSGSISFNVNHSIWAPQVKTCLHIPPIGSFMLGPNYKVILNGRIVVVFVITTKCAEVKHVLATL